MNEWQKAITRDLANGRPGVYTPDRVVAAQVEQLGLTHDEVKAAAQTDQLAKVAA